MANSFHSNGVIKWSEITKSAYHDNGVMAYSAATRMAYHTLLK